MNFSQVVQAVMDITKRPDKKVETERAVNAALSYLILKGEFYQDLLEYAIAIDSALYTGQVSLAPLTRFRKMKFVNPLNTHIYLTKIDPNQLFTPGNMVQSNVYYITGLYLNYSIGILNTVLNLGYYSYPPTLANNDEFWFLEALPEAIIDRAAGIVFKGIGDDASMNTHFSLSKELYDVYVRDLHQP